MTRTSPADTLPANARQISAVVGDRQGKGAGQSTGAGLGLTPSVFAAKLLRDSFKIRKGVETLLKQAGKQHENQASQKHPQGFWDKVKKLLGLLPQSGIANMPKNPAGNAVQRPAIQRSEQDAITRNMTQTTQDIKRLAEEATNAAEASSGAQAQLNPQVASITTQPLSRQSSLQSFVASRHSSMPSLVSAEKSSSSTPRLGNQNQNLQTQGSFEVFPENFPATSASSGSLASEASARAPQVTSSASIASSDAPSKTAESVNIQELLNDLLSTSKTLEDKVILAWQLLQKPEMSQPDEALILETLKFKIEDISTNDSELEHKLSALTAIRMAMGGFQTNNTWLESAPNDVNMDTMYKLNEMFKITLPRLDALLQSNKLNAKSTALAILAKIPYLKIRISTESFVQWQNFSVEIQFEKPVPFERHLIKNIAGAGTPELLVLAGVSPDQIQINQKTIGQSELNKLMLLKNNISNIGKTLLSEKRPDTASFI